MSLTIRNNERENNSLKPNKRIIQAERGEVIYREDIKTSFAYALVGLTAIVAAIGVTLGAGGIAYSFIKQLKKE